MTKQIVSKRTKQTLAGFVFATALAIGGYYQFHEKLVALGADVKRVEEADDEN